MARVGGSPILLLFLLLFSLLLPQLLSSPTPSASGFIMPNPYFHSPIYPVWFYLPSLPQISRSAIASPFRLLRVTRMVRRAPARVFTPPPSTCLPISALLLVDFSTGFLSLVVAIWMFVVLEYECDSHSLVIIIVISDWYKEVLMCL